VVSGSVSLHQSSMDSPFTETVPQSHRGRKVAGGSVLSRTSAMVYFGRSAASTEAMPTAEGRLKGRFIPSAAMPTGQSIEFAG
jgi:hypothetical protein